MNNIMELSEAEIARVCGSGWCEAGWMTVGGIAGAGIGGAISGGWGAAAGFSFGVSIGQDLGEAFCS